MSRDVTKKIIIWTVAFLVLYGLISGAYMFLAPESDAPQAALDQDVEITILRAEWTPADVLQTLSRE